MNDKYRWYSCAQCFSLKIQPDQYVGKVRSDDGDLLPVQEWQMKRPSVLAALNNQYEQGQVGLCGLFSTTVGVLNGTTSKVRLMQSTNWTVTYYYSMFGFLASKDNSINAYSPNPESSLRIHHALQWLQRHNHLYKSFFSNYETL